VQSYVKYSQLINKYYENNCSDNGLITTTVRAIHTTHNNVTYLLHCISQVLQAIWPRVCGWVRSINAWHTKMRCKWNYDRVSLNYLLFSIRRKILPLAVLGISSTNFTPPRSFLYGAALAEIHNSTGNFIG
jgi:hypothetical protein